MVDGEAAYPSSPVIAYTVGALVYAFERSDPWPRIFGHHEIWHLFVLLGAGCHFLFNSVILSAH